MECLLPRNRRDDELRAQIPTPSMLVGGVAQATLVEPPTFATVTVSDRSYMASLQATCRASSSASVLTDGSTAVLEICDARGYRDAVEFDAPTTFERESEPWQRFHDDVFNAASLLQIPTHAIAASRSSKNATLHDPAVATFMKCLVNLSG